jgi:uncharacterized membrane protein
VREQLRTGFWFIPLLAVLVAWATSSLMRRVDEWLGGDSPQYLAFNGNAEQANQVLSTIAGSTLTFTGVVFSITAVALQLGSSQFSPRVLRTFLRDRGTQWTLAVLVATFTYALFTLRSVNIEPGPGEIAVPGLSVSLALAAVLAALVTFVWFVNHLAQSIRVVSIIERVAKETRSTIRETIPEAPSPPPARAPARPPDRVITWERGPAVLIGYDERDLVALARSARVVLRFVRQVGDYVPSQVPIVEVWADDPAGSGDGAPRGGRHAGPGALDTEAVLRHIGAGPERTMSQDPMFGFRQLVDIAERALSPALNDPTTAVQSLDRIHDLLRRIAVRPQPTGVHADDQGRPRLFVPVPTWDDFVHLACDELRHYGSSSIQLVRRMRAMLEDLLQLVPPERTVVLRDELGMLDRAAVAFAEPTDRALAGEGDHQGLGT